MVHARGLAFILAAGLISACWAPPAGAASESVFHAFRYPPKGDYPVSLLYLGGKLYGTTYYGGASGKGTVFEVFPKGSEKVIYSFQGAADGANPYGGLIEVNGMLYGTANDGGGESNCGVVFSMTLTGIETVIHTFTGDPDGCDPSGNLLNVKGVLYGTTQAGGAGNVGTVFSVTPGSVEMVLHSFNDADGEEPMGSLVAVGGELYGVTLQGSLHGGGTIFAITPAGALTTLHSFGLGSDGAGPFTGLVNVDGLLYGTTEYGGGADCFGGPGCGTVFSVTTSGVEKVIYSFQKGVDGELPQGSLIYKDGILYGTTFVGGGSPGCYGYGCGTVFSISTATGAEEVLHAFQGGSDSEFPGGNLIYEAWDGALYGVTSGKQGRDNWGAVFAIQLDGVGSGISGTASDRR